ncbi:hypothetical protein IFM89_032794 [Coptis chinensis]|uniref:DUF4283 domain-containing protein n=1 Tax=Coptis chinensis TaxID=261450 RepID=A0A835HR42_9MAGN|nr:hypothetical protein IFM89_032794 [Coptis chinensis]
MQHNNVNATGNQASNWSSLFQGGNVSTSDTSLQRFELDMIEGVTQVPMDLRWKGLNVWKEYVVGFFLEQRLPYPVVKEFLKKKWKTKGVYEMVADADLFYFKFSNEEDKRKVLENPQIFMAGKCFIVTQWTQDIERRKDVVKAIPIWVNLYNVPKVLWTGEGLGEENTVHNAAPVTTSNNEINREDRGAQTVEGATGGTMNVINLGIGGLNVAGVDLNSPENTMGEDNGMRVDDSEETRINAEDSTVGLDEMNAVMEMVENEVRAIVLATSAEVPEEIEKRKEYESNSESDVCQSNMFAALVPFENTRIDEMQTNPDPLMHYEVEQNEYNNLLVAARNGDLSDEESLEEETIYFKDKNNIPLSV